MQPFDKLGFSISYISFALSQAFIQTKYYECGIQQPWILKNRDVKHRPLFRDVQIYSPWVLIEALDFSRGTVCFVHAAFKMTILPKRSESIAIAVMTDGNLNVPLGLNAKFYGSMPDRQHRGASTWNCMLTVRWALILLSLGMLT
jgi:hypothetical protein